MTLTTAQMVQAEAAKRMLADKHFLAILNRITENAAAKSVFDDDAMIREANRQLVLAISRIKGELKADADMPEADREQEQLNRAME